LDLERTDPTSGRGWARAGFLTGIVASIAANVARIYVPPKHAPLHWHPPHGAIVAAGFWPVGLLISIEIISRVQWPDGLIWWLIRYGGLTAVAAIAAVISYRHMSGLLAAYGEAGVGAAIGPLAVDGLMVVSSGALLAIGDNVRRAARAAELADQAAAAPVPVPPESAQMAIPGASEPVPEGGAPPAPGLDLTALTEALSELHADGGVSGPKLAAAMQRRGRKADERTARAVLAMLRPGSGAEAEADEQAVEEPAAAVEQAGALELAPA
jgi:hypothetical protein